MQLSKRNQYIQRLESQFLQQIKYQQKKASLSSSLVDENNLKKSPQKPFYMSSFNEPMTGKIPLNNNETETQSNNKSHRVIRNMLLFFSPCSSIDLLRNTSKKMNGQKRDKYRSLYFN